MSSHEKNIGFKEEKLARYIADHSKSEDPLLKELSRETFLKIYHPRRSSNHLSGHLLKMFSSMIQPQNILEIGTFTGYGAISLAKGLAPGGMLHTIEINDELEDFTRRWIDKAGLTNNITLHIGDALEIIPQLGTSFDLVFIDGEKNQYAAYYEAIIDKVRSGGFILADNVLWSGKVVDKDIPAKDHFTRGIVEFNQLIQKDDRVDNMLLPVFDGIMVIQKK
jgi:caffeoyl-CoA O-methyltransferase